MVATLGAEQNDDNDKREYCNAQFDLSDDKKKGLERSVSNLEKAIAKAKEGIAALTDELAALAAVSMASSLKQHQSNRNGRAAYLILI